MSAAKRRAAILGGTFNPIHNGHLYLVRAFADALALDEVILMISNIPPHKAAPDLASNADRLAMAACAQASEPRIRPCDLELRRGGKSYTAETLRYLTRRHRDTEYYFLTGADMFLTLPAWYRPREIFRRAVICASPRAGQPLAELEAFAPQLHAMGARTILLPVNPPPVSSTEIRARVRAGLPIDGLVPPEVAEYIASHGLYRAPKGETAHDAH